MGLLDGVLGGVIGGEMVSVVNGLIQQHGGLSGMIEQFKSQGMGETIKSWVGSGPNQPISSEQLQQALGSDTIAQLASKVGMTPQELSEKLSTVLPEIVDKMTPAGVVPATH